MRRREKNSRKWARKTSRNRSRRLGVESLEVRRVLTAWHNDANAFDVDNVNGVTPLDALIVINEITNRVFSDPSSGALPDTRPTDAPFLDVQNNAVVGPLDALLVINNLPNTNPDPDPEPNKFTVPENATNGTVVGTVTPIDGANADSRFEFQKPDSVPDSIQDILDLKSTDHIAGASNGSVILIEYVDFACPVCGLYHPLYKQALQDFPDELVYVTRHLPLTTIHPNAEAAAVAAEAAGRQGRFDEMADLLFERRTSTGWDVVSNPTAIFQGFAVELGLNLGQFNADIADTALLDRVQADSTDAIGGLGATGTPTIVVNNFRESNPGTSQTAVNTMIQNAIDAVETPFRIDIFTGEITVRDGSLLDFETQSTYQLDVTVNGKVESITIDLTDVAE